MKTLIKSIKVIKQFKFLQEYENENIIYRLTHSERYIRFTSKIIREKVGLLGNEKWAGIKDLIAWE